MCRFGAPWPPMRDTVILRPLKDEDHQYMEKHKQTNKHIQKFLTDLKPEDYNITFFPLLIRNNNVKIAINFPYLFHNQVDISVHFT